MRPEFSSGSGLAQQIASGKKTPGPSELFAGATHVLVDKGSWDHPSSSTTSPFPNSGGNIASLCNNHGAYVVIGIIPEMLRSYMCQITLKCKQYRAQFRSRVQGKMAIA